MIYELRTYRATPGRITDLNRRFAEVTLGFMKKYEIRMHGFWTYEIGGPSNELIYMLVWESLAERETKWSVFMKDKDRLAAFAESEKNGKLVEANTSQILRPTAYSPLQ